jgi:AcrR family transcriptional regulator
MPKPLNPSLRNNILTTALQLLDERGTASFSMRELGRRLGYSATALYRYFPSRDHLLLALTLHIGEQLTRELEDACRHPGLEQQMSGLVDAYLRFGFENPAAFRFLFQYMITDLTTTPEQRTHFNRGWQIVRETLRRWLVAHGIHRVDVEQEAQMEWALVHGVTSLALAQRGPFRDHDRAQVLLNQAMQNWQWYLLNRHRINSVRRDTSMHKKHSEGEKNKTVRRKKRSYPNMEDLRHNKSPT